MSPAADIVARAFWEKGVFPHQFAWLIDNPLRRALISPRRLANRLPLRPDSTVLEVGPGSGYFSVELARRVPEGHLHLVDIQPEMLRKARTKLQAHGLRNISFTTIDAGAGFPFAPARFDIAVLVSVLGEVTNPGACLLAVFDVLRPGATLAIHESVPDPDLIRLDRLLELTQKSCFTLTRRHGPRFNYTALLRRP
jgi:ubiquinone/menaquinone biosynthesis C-methylase UbiE